MCFSHRKNSEFWLEFVLLTTLFQIRDFLGVGRGSGSIQETREKNLYVYFSLSGLLHSFPSFQIVLPCSQEIWFLVSNTPFTRYFYILFLVHCHCVNCTRHSLLLSVAIWLNVLRYFIGHIFFLTKDKLMKEHKIKSYWRKMKDIWLIEKLKKVVIVRDSRPFINHKWYGKLHLSYREKTLYKQFVS